MIKTRILPMKLSNKEVQWALCQEIQKKDCLHLYCDKCLLNPDTELNSTEKKILKEMIGE